MKIQNRKSQIENRKSKIQKSLRAFAFFAFLFLLGAQGVNRPILGTTDWPEPNRGMPESVAAFHEPTLFYENEYTGGMFFSKDGWKYVGNLFYFKLGPQLRWGITVSVTDPNGKYYLGKTEIDPKKLTFSKDTIDVKFGESFITGKNPNYHLHYVTDKVTIDLEYKSRTKIWAPGGEGQPGQGKFHFGPDKKFFLHTAVVAPWADAKGHIVVDGKKVAVEGQGFIDHGRYSVPFNRHFTTWEGFIAFNFEPINGHFWNITVFDYLIHPEFGGNRVPTLLVIKDNKILSASPFYTLEPLDFRKDPKLGIEFPWRYTLRSSGGACSVQGVSMASQSWETLDILGELPDYARAIVLKFLKRPVYWRAFGTFDGTVTCGGETVQFRGTPSFHDANYVR